jgi:pimeloyl-ACP methyl ester carboxylesterase
MSRTTTDASSGGTAHEADQPGAPVEAGYVETNGIRTYYERRGEGPPVVFVHGMVMRTTMWARQLATLNGEYTASVDSTAEGESTDKPTTSVVGH